MEGSRPMVVTVTDMGCGFKKKKGRYSKREEPQILRIDTGQRHKPSPMGHDEALEYETSDFSGDSNDNYLDNSNSKRNRNRCERV